MESIMQQLELLNQKFQEGTISPEESEEYQQLLKDFADTLLDESSHTVEVSSPAAHTL